MILKAFHPATGQYRFELNQLEAEMHAHPCLEFIEAREGKFTLQTEQERFEACQ